MSITTMSAREFARDLSQAKRATEGGPVFVTNRGVPTFALLRIEDYYKLAEQPTRSLLEVMDSLPGGEFEFRVPKLGNLGLRPVEME